MAEYRYLCNETVLENYAFLVYMYYMHPGYWTSIFGKNRIIFKFLLGVSLMQQVVNHSHCSVLGQRYLYRSA